MEPDYTIEEQVTFVLANFENDDIGQQYAHKNYQIIGIEEGAPFIQIGSKVYRGEIDATLGSMMFFEYSNSTTEEIPKDADQSKKQKKDSGPGLIATTNKIINFQQVLLDPK
ncbi:hypothetical protein BB559_000466 [Furculomyces boomerangus]|uniref:Transcription factor TFIIIC triple barrel domain-containing protein n=2 Tax=Harpellales TaxID=61421 RepID=A0A2T9Z529_9FUNG|nr:hypothetical protein BB559_000466 [Furculomyces boomerangus]PWA02666.1 hypothetical protein BB558_001192 [Smittium angustum]